MPRVTIVPHGAELLPALEETDGQDGWIQGVGRLESIEVVTAAGENVVFTGAHALVSLAGPTSGPWMIVLSRGDAGELLGGQLVRARSLGVSLARFVTSQEKESWAAVAARAAAETAGPDADESTELPKVGDRVDHFAFGICDVLHVRPNRMKIRSATGGKLREISLEVVRVLPPTELGGKRVFGLVKRA